MALTLNAENSNIIVHGDTGTAQELYLNGNTFNNFEIQSTAGSTFYVYGSNTFNQFSSDTNPHTINFDANTTQTVTRFNISGLLGNPIVINSMAKGSIVTHQIVAGPNQGTGYSALEECFIVSNNGVTNDAKIRVDTVDGSGAITSYTLLNAGTDYKIADTNILGGNSDGWLSIDSITIRQHILSKSSGVVQCDYLDISNSNGTGGAQWYAGAHSVDTTNNDGWIFEDHKNRHGFINFQSLGIA